MPMLSDFRLQPNVPGFHLQDDLKNWKEEPVSVDTSENARPMGFLTIYGQRCVVFITPSGDQWAQKSQNITPDMLEDEESEDLEAEKPVNVDTARTPEEKEEITEDVDDVKPAEGKSEGKPREAFTIERIASRLARPRINFVFKR